MSVHLALLISVLYLCNVYVQPKALLEEDQENQQVSVLSGSQRFLITYLKEWFSIKNTCVATNFTYLPQRHGCPAVRNLTNHVCSGMCPSVFLPYAKADGDNCQGCLVKSYTVEMIKFKCENGTTFMDRVDIIRSCQCVKMSCSVSTDESQPRRK